MKHILILLFALLLFVGCEKLNRQIDVMVSESENTSSSKETDIEQSPIELDLVSGEYGVIWRESYKYDTPILIDNLTDWIEFLKNYPMQSVNEDILQKNYNDEFFKGSVVYAYVKSEGSSSIKLTVKKAELSGDTLNLFMERIVPEEGTTDMATLVCLFGIKRNDIKNVKTIEGIILNKVSE